MRQIVWRILLEKIWIEVNSVHGHRRCAILVDYVHLIRVSIRANITSLVVKCINDYNIFTFRFHHDLGLFPLKFQQISHTFK